jgi:hypothetical protein
MSWMVRTLGAVERKRRGWLAMMLARCGGMFTAMSISPFCSAATRTESSGMGRKISVLILGAPRQYCSLAVSSICSSFTQRTNLNGPEPTGFRLR